MLPWGAEVPCSHGIGHGEVGGAGGGAGACGADTLGGAPVVHLEDAASPFAPQSNPLLHGRLDGAALAAGGEVPRICKDKVGGGAFTIALCESG